MKTVIAEALGAFGRAFELIHVTEPDNDHWLIHQPRQDVKYGRGAIHYNERIIRFDSEQSARDYFTQYTTPIIEVTK